MSNNISLNEVKNAAFLASENSKTEILKNRVITNPATNSSFEVYNQAGNDSSGFSATVFRNISKGAGG